MGIFESMMRSQDNINQLAGVVQGYFKRKHDDEVRQKVKDLFTTYSGGAQEEKAPDMQGREVTPAPLGPGSRPQMNIQHGGAISIPSVIPGQPEPQVPIAGGPEGVTQRFPQMELQPNTPQGKTISSLQVPLGSIGERGYSGPVTREAAPDTTAKPKATMRGIQSADDIYKLAELTDQDPSRMVQDATAEEQRNVPQTHFGSRGEVYQVDRKGNVNRIRGAEFPPTKEPNARADKPILLRSLVENINGVKKKADYYGFPGDESSPEQVTDKKYSDFTPTKGMNLTGVGGDGKDKKEFKRSAALKALDAKKQAMERELKRAYPEVDLDHAIVNGVDDTAPSAELTRKWLKAIDDYETRASVEGEEIEPAFSVAEKHLSEQAIPAHDPNARTAGPAAPRTPKVGDIAVNKKTGERRKLNANGQWEKIQGK